MPDLRNTQGEPTGAIYGVVNMMRRILLDYPAQYAACVFDARGKTFRDDLYPDYKSHRPSMPEDLASQIEPIHAAVRAMGWSVLSVPGVEADDVIGTLAQWAQEQDIHTVISTGDKDLAQLVTSHITLVNTMSGSSMDVEGVKEKFGVAPEQIIDYLALMGDSSDNIPGVPGIGPKTASGLLVGVNGGLTELYAQLDIVPTLPIRGAKTLPAKLEEHKEMAFLSYQLATIKVDVPLDIGLDDLQMGPEDPAKLYELYTLLEFKSWLNDLDRDAKRLELSSAAAEPEPAADLFSAAEEAQAPAVAAQAQYETILDQARFDVWLEKLNSAKLFAFDTETTGIDAQQAQLVGLSFAVQANEAAYIPLTHSYIGVPEQLDRDTVLRALKPILEDPNKLKVGQHAKFDMNILANCAIGGDQANGITVRGSIVGTRLDLQESLDFAAKGKVKATVETARLEDINTVFDRMHKGQIEGRVVMDLAA